MGITSDTKLVDLGGLKTAIDLIFDAFTTRTAKHINAIEQTASDTLVFRCVDGTTACTLANATYDTFTGASASTNGTRGLVPAPSSGDQNKYLCGNGSWASVPAAYTHPSYTARTGNPTTNQTPTFGGTFTVSQITSDATGHVTAANDKTVTIPSLPTASAATAGVVKVGSGLTITDAFLSVDTSELILPSVASSHERAIWIV